MLDFPPHIRVFLQHMHILHQKNNTILFLTLAHHDYVGLASGYPSSSDYCLICPTSSSIFTSFCVASLSGASADQLSRKGSRVCVAFVCHNDITWAPTCLGFQWKAARSLFLCPNAGLLLRSLFLTASFHCCIFLSSFLSFFHPSFFTLHLFGFKSVPGQHFVSLCTTWLGEGQDSPLWHMHCSTCEGKRLTAFIL